MRKTTISIDDELVAKASAILGTKGIKDTVNRALYEVLVYDARLHEIERLKRLDLNDLEVMKGAWQ